MTDSSPPWFTNRSSRARSTRTCAAGAAATTGAAPRTTTTLATSPTCESSAWIASSDAVVAMRHAKSPLNASLPQVSGGGEMALTAPSPSARRSTSAARAPDIGVPGSIVTRMTIPPASGTGAFSARSAGTGQVPVAGRARRYQLVGQLAILDRVVTSLRGEADPLLHPVHHPEPQLDQLRAWRHRPFAHRRQHVLERVRQVRQPGVAQRGGHPFHRVDVPEEFRDRRVLRQVTFPGQELRVALLQVLPALGDEERDVFRRLRHPA